MVEPKQRSLLRLAPAARVRTGLRVVARRSASRYWFPHVPLFFATACLGVALLLHTLGFALHHEDILTSSGVVIAALVNGAPSVVAGVFLILMSLGLLTRSRLAWTITILVASLSLVLVWRLWPGGLAGHERVAAGGLLLLFVLVLSVGQFRRSSIASASLFAITSVVALLAYAVVGADVLGGQFAPPISDFNTALYFAVVTMSTVGYGDILPKTPEARLFAMSIMLLGITVFATSVSALLVPLITRRMTHILEPRERAMPRSDHYVIVSDSALARNTWKELRARDQEVVFILDQAPDHEEEGMQVIIGDASSLEVLCRAEADRARAVLALGDDDSENAFVVLAAKELGQSVRTVATVNDARNLARVKRVHPDVVIAPHVLGGEILAMALSGERVDGEGLVNQLLHFNT